jgi:hypothetical protein
MAKGTIIKHTRKAGAFVNGELQAGEWGLDVTNSAWYYSINGTTVLLLATTVAALGNIGNVVVPSPADNDVLAWDSGTGKWTNQTAAQAGHIAASEKGAANGVATLDAGGKVPSSQMPVIALTNVNTVASQAAQLALTAQEGDVAIRTDLGKTYIHNSGNAGTMADWSEMTEPGLVQSVFGRVGAVVAAANDYAASQINNDSGVTGTGVAAALNTLNAGKAASSHVHSGADITSGTIPTAAMQTNAAAALQASSGTLSNANLIIDGGSI